MELKKPLTSALNSLIYSQYQTPSPSRCRSPFVSNRNSLQDHTPPTRSSTPDVFTHRQFISPKIVKASHELRVESPNKDSKSKKWSNKGNIFLNKRLIASNILLDSPEIRKRV